MLRQIPRSIFHTMTDQKEKELFKNFINAQYEYFKYIEPKRIREIEDRIRGKVLNPYHWKVQTYGLCPKEEKPCTGNDLTELPSCKKKDTKDYKKLLAMIHPDKNLDRTEEATRYFQFVQSLIDNGNEEELDQLIGSDNPWVLLEEMTDCDSLYMKRKYCEKTRITMWFMWTPEDDAMYVTEEELKELIRVEMERLRKEHEQLSTINRHLRAQNKQLKEYIEKRNQPEQPEQNKEDLDQGQNKDLDQSQNKDLDQSQNKDSDQYSDQGSDKDKKSSDPGPSDQ
jgi:hypothetical protein